VGEEQKPLPVKNCQSAALFIKFFFPNLPDPASLVSSTRRCPSSHGINTCTIRLPVASLKRIQTLKSGFLGANSRPTRYYLCSVKDMKIFSTVKWTHLKDVLSLQRTHASESPVCHDNEVQFHTYWLGLEDHHFEPKSHCQELSSLSGMVFSLELLCVYVCMHTCVCILQIFLVDGIFNVKFII
jgi:hypothetical protein